MEMEVMGRGCGKLEGDGSSPELLALSGCRDIVHRHTHPAGACSTTDPAGAIDPHLDYHYAHVCVGRNLNPACSSRDTLHIPSKS